MKLILFLEAFRIFQINFYNEPLPYCPPRFSSPHIDDKHNKQQVRASSLLRKKNIHINWKGWNCLLHFGLALISTFCDVILTSVSFKSSLWHDYTTFDYFHTVFRGCVSIQTYSSLFVKIISKTSSLLIIKPVKDISVLLRVNSTFKQNSEDGNQKEWEIEN